MIPATPPMTLGNMRENGVRSLTITCHALGCHHASILDVSTFGDAVTVPSFGPRMVCVLRRVVEYWHLEITKA